jgi:hypothetical protein
MGLSDDLPAVFLHSIKALGLYEPSKWTRAFLAGFGQNQTTVRTSAGSEIVAQRPPGCGVSNFDVFVNYEHMMTGQ